MCLESRSDLHRSSRVLHFLLENTCVDTQPVALSLGINLKDAHDAYFFLEWPHGLRVQLSLAPAAAQVRS